MAAFVDFPIRQKGFTVGAFILHPLKLNYTLQVVYLYGANSTYTMVIKVNVNNFKPRTCLFVIYDKQTRAKLECYNTDWI